MSDVIVVNSNTQNVLSVSADNETQVVQITAAGPQGIAGAVQSITFDPTSSVSITSNVSPDILTLNNVNTSGTFTFSLPTQSVTPGTYGNSTHIPLVTVNDVGIITGISTETIASVAVSSVSAGTGISVSASTGAVTISNTGVTSAALSDGSSTPIYTISGSPITTTGTLTFTLVNQSAHAVLAGPTSGSAAQPTFRALVAGDIPSLSYVTSVGVSGGTTGLTTSGGPITSSGTITLAGTLAIANGGTGQTTQTAAFDALSPLTTEGDIIYFNGTHNVRLGAGTSGYVLSTQGTGAAPQWVSASAGSGTVTSVAASAGAGISVTGSPITTSGTLTITNTGVTSIAGTSNEITASASTGSVTLSIPSTFTAPGTIQDSTGMLYSTTTGISAAGTTQGTATALTTSYNVITTVAASSGVVLPTAVAGLINVIVNLGAHTLNIYPASGGAIDGAATNAPITLTPNTSISFQGNSSTQWYTVDQPMIAGSGISVTPTNGGITLANTGATSITGTTNEITASASTGAVTLSFPSFIVANVCDNVVNAGTVTSGTVIVNCNNGNLEEITLGASGLTINITNCAATANTTQLITVLLIQGTGGSFTLPSFQLNGVATTSTTLRWDSGLTPVLTTTAGKTDIIQLLAVNIAGTITLYGGQVIGNA